LYPFASVQVLFSQLACVGIAGKQLGPDNMNTKPIVKLIKKQERNGPQFRSTVELAVGPDRWSKAVRSWVSEFQQQQRRGASLPAFDSLFK
jgi:hypothetical protein